MEPRPYQKKCTKCGQLKDAVMFSKYCRSKDGLQPSCKKCYSEYYQDNKCKNRAYRLANDERIKITKKKYREENRAKVALYQKNYRDKNKESLSVQESGYRSRNIDKVRSRAAEYNRVNKAKHKAKRQSPEGRAIVKMSNYRRRSRNVNSPAEASKVKAWLSKAHSQDRFTCFYCKNTFGQKSLHVDHYVPISKGGRNVVENLVTSCSRCNRRKSDKCPERFIMEMNCE